MGFKSRKFRIWLISLGAVLVVYLLYSWISRTPHIDIDTVAESTGVVADSNVDQFGSEIGMIGDVGVRRVQKAKFLDYNKDKEVVGEFGFERLLHETGDEWEIEKPYRNIFQRNFKCYITADRGNVLLEPGVDRPSPKDATFTGNVVIHILPESGSDIKQSFIYLDDIVFISEKSSFSTAGPVKFVSEDAQMLGTGLELVYNDELDRLEFLRIIHLDSLRLKAPSKAPLFSSLKTDFGGPAGTSSQVKTQLLAEPIAADVPQKPKPLQTTSQQGKDYRCVFSKNVVIDCPEQLIFADEVSINNIFFSKSSSIEHRASSIEYRASSIEHRDTRDEQFVDIVVTCDNGILVTPMDSTRAPKDFANFKPETAAANSQSAKILNDTTGRTTFVAQRIDYCVVTGDTIASGHSELTFCVNDVMGAEAKGATVPVKITAQKKAKFLPALNQVTFEGDSLCKMLREDSGIKQRYTLSAPRLTVNLSDSATDIEHLTADGGVVKLALVKMAEENLLGGIELKCPRFDYDPGQRLLLATGPGVIKVDNSKISEQKKKKKKLGKFSLRRPCYALLRDFETLRYFLDANRIIADAKSQGIFIDYIPIVEGQYGQQVSATASHIEALLYETADGRTELSTLSATGGITYEEEGKKKRWGKGKAIQFVGSDFFYDASKSMLMAWGDKSQPCLLNGVFVDGIEYNLKTGRVKTKIVAPGALQME